MKPNAHFLIVIVLACILFSSTAAAIDEAPALNQAQTLVFMGNHLHNVATGRILTYRLSRRAVDEDEIIDTVRMKVTGVAADGGRDLDFEFLSGDRHVPFPSAHGYKGNPITIQFLERDVRDMTLAAGGSSSYFRNRVRNAFTDPTIRAIRIRHEGAEVDAVEIVVTPFAKDARANAELAAYRDKSYRFVFSEHIPGGLYLIHTHVPGNSGPKLEEELKFSSADTAPSS